MKGNAIVWLGQRQVELARTRDGWTCTADGRSRSSATLVEAISGVVESTPPYVVMFEEAEAELLDAVLDELSPELLVLTDQALVATFDTETEDIDYERVSEHGSAIVSHVVLIADDRCGAIVQLAGHVFVEWQHAEGQYLGRLVDSPDLLDHPALQGCHLESVSSS